jgi:hypothetical protein
VVYGIRYGQFMETALVGGPYRHGYVVAWFNHSVLVLFFVPWAALVVAERGFQRRALWHALVQPYGSLRRLLWITFRLSFQYQLFNYAYWSWLPLASSSSAQVICQSQCIFVFVFSVAMHKATAWTLVQLYAIMTAAASLARLLLTATFQHCRATVALCFSGCEQPWPSSVGGGAEGATVSRATDAGAAVRRRSGHPHLR